MDSQTSLKTSQRGGCNPLNPPPGSASAMKILLQKCCPWNHNTVIQIEVDQELHTLTPLRVKLDWIILKK